MGLPPRTGYSRAEFVSDLAVHVLALGAALVAVPILVARACRLGGEATLIAAVLAYGVTLVAMILCSALCNAAGADRRGLVLRKLDHSAIYLKIAGTYTPFALLSHSPAGGFLTWIWTCALLGAGLRSFAQDRLRWAAIGLYLVMGWSGAAAGPGLFDGMAPGVFALVLTGGLLYTSGFAFFLLRRLPFHRTIWHLFVAAASAVFFVAVNAQVLDALSEPQAVLRPGVPAELRGS